MVTNSKPERAAYKIKEFAALIGTCDKSVRRAIQRGKIKTIRIFRCPLIPRSELQRLLNEAM